MSNLFAGFIFFKSLVSMDWLTPGGMRRKLKSPWGFKKAITGVVFVAAISIFVAIAINRNYAAIFSSTGCQFPAIYNFGDSNSDTGARSATFYRIASPYGSTFFGKPSGRYSDGRLIIDFIGKYNCIRYPLPLYAGVAVVSLVIFFFNHYYSAKARITVLECIYGFYWNEFSTWSKFCHWRVNDSANGW